MAIHEVKTALSDSPRPAVESLPPVAPPTATFILQLFLIPLLIVTIVVLLWLLFGWLAHMGHDNAADLVRGIERGDNGSGQLAFELAGLLRSPDPKYDALRADEALAKRLASFLERDLAEPLTRSDDKRVMRRMYLCRVIGEFHVPTGLDVLLKAAGEERDPVDVEIRFSALEAIASLADHCGQEALRTSSVLDVVLAASRATDGSASRSTSTAGEAPLYRPHAELRAVAAYCLGVIGGDQATDRLAQMLHDPYPNARYNAATGLARDGDVRSEVVLREMLDPANDLAVKDEAYPNDQARKRTTVLLNGIKATLRFAEANPNADLTTLNNSLQKLTTDPLQQVTIDRGKVKTAATEALRLIDKTQMPH
jgi:HEAT repeat protein